MAYQSRTWTYHVFASFYGPDVRKTFISNVRKQFSFNGITMFDEQEIERSHSLGPAFIQAIRESKISIVVFSKNFASSKWCLDVLVEILNCKKEREQLVIPIFYGVDQSDVRKQTGDFGRGFKETCAQIKTEEQRRRWAQALTKVGYIAGEDFLNWDNEGNMIEKIAKDISNKLNVTPNKDFDDMVGIEAHLTKMASLLQLDSESDEAMIVGICGPTGVGKTTIVRALYSQLSGFFQLTCFMDNLRGSYSTGLDDYSLKLGLQEQLLSKILNQNGVKISHLGVIRERLSNLRVLIILDDVDDLKQLEALANETTWFGPGSRIIVTTKDQGLLSQHGIANTYQMDFPSTGEALEILCKIAFRKSSPPDGFKDLAIRVTNLCGNLPSNLRVVGSFLRGKNEEEWEEVMRKLETNYGHQDIEQVLRLKYEPLSTNKRIGKSKSGGSSLLGKKEEEWGEVTHRVEIIQDDRDIDHLLRLDYDPPLTNELIGKSRCSTGMAYLVVINLLVEIASAISDQLSSLTFARISLAMSVLSVFLSILDLIFQIRVHKARFQCKWPIPWFYYPSRRYNNILGNFIDTALLVCVVSHLVVSGINYRFIQKRQDAPINVLVWPLVFAIGMVISKFLEKRANSKHILPTHTKRY